MSIREEVEPILPPMRVSAVICRIVLANPPCLEVRVIESSR